MHNPSLLRYETHDVDGDHSSGLHQLVGRPYLMDGLASVHPADGFGAVNCHPGDEVMMVAGCVQPDCLQPEIFAGAGAVNCHPKLADCHPELAACQPELADCQPECALPCRHPEFPALPVLQLDA